MGSSRLDRMAGLSLVKADWDVEEVLLIDSHLHGEAGDVCPRCLRWIDPRDFVRQTAFGPLQHEVCPPEVTVA
ncbi:MAG: hypothetical protein JWO22_1234 [Frankiales bacterium]|nr:hypothetical protein [Frankiales bacterium]